MTSTKYYRMMERPHHSDTTNPGGSAQEDCSHACRPGGGYLLGAATVAGLVLVFQVKGGLPPSDSQELAWLDRLAAANNPDAQLQLGLACRTAHGVWIAILTRPRAGCNALPPPAIRWQCRPWPKMVIQLIDI
jgi:hypothetical protein